MKDRKELIHSRVDRSTIGIFLLAFGSVLGLFTVEFFPTTVSVADAEIKYKASQRTYEAFQKIREKALSQNLAIDPNLDPADSALIGPELSPVTSSAGKLSAKQASVHPDFTAWFLEQFRNSNLKKGDTIAVGMSGSFPALNISFWIAADTMGLKVVSIASVSSSQYGSNRIGFLWPDLENELYQKNSIFQKSIYMSTGGISDSGIGIGKEGRDSILFSIRKNGYSYLSSDSFQDSLDKRMKIYGKSNPALYVNIGGGTVSSGTSLGKKKIPKGIVVNEEEVSELPDSVLKLFLERKIPVLHVGGIEKIASQSKMKYERGSVPKPGTSDLIFPKKYDRIRAGLLLLFLSALIWKTSTWISLPGSKEENQIFL
ncbi:poly-gamma-glutamate system protein [Leptospira sanjuanensis]|uniref:poly-gamma-glutamate system protein n=1 Tax=Leptospira sanjuanensis TaxID=2879643 RepID=UPI001EE86C18|nr:poly-gamma-glutamate system protein [Leptospira sanjuanensis]MCG6168298.1 poly-gamma-glutamate system protein [Leptospira sanjuanensis]